MRYDRTYKQTEKKINRDYYCIDAILKYFKNKISIYLHLNFEFDNFYLMITM